MTLGGSRLGFLHVPKAAGTSMVVALADALGGSRSPWVFDTTLFAGFDQFDAMSPEARQRIFRGVPADLAGYQLVAGHYSLQNLRSTLPAERILTVLREPRVRLLSHYFYWVATPPGGFDAFLPWDMPQRAVRMSLAQFLSAPELACQTDNLCTRMLLAPNPHLPATQFLADRSPLSRYRVRRRAMHLLRSLGCAVPLELGPALSSAIERWAGLPLAVPHLNRTDRDRLRVDAGWCTPEVERLLKLRTSVDRVLWTWSCHQHGLDPAQAADDAWHSFVGSLDVRENTPE